MHQVVAVDDDGRVLVDLLPHPDVGRLAPVDVALATCRRAAEVGWVLVSVVAKRRVARLHGGFDGGDRLL